MNSDDALRIIADFVRQRDRLFQRHGRTTETIGNRLFHRVIRVEMRNGSPVRAWINCANDPAFSLSYTFNGRGKRKTSFGDRDLPASAMRENILEVNV